MTTTARSELSVCDNCATSRGKVRASFLEREKAESYSYISDLETTIAINKSIIQNLCDTTDKGALGCKKALCRLNEENAVLQQQNKILKKQRDESMGKALILEQMIEEIKSKDQEQIDELREKNAELIEQLNCKEYHVQVFEKRYNDAEALFLKYLKTIPESMQALGVIRSPIVETRSISNVVVQNSQLKEKIAELVLEISRLKKELAGSEARKLNEILKDKINSLVAENEEQRMKMEVQGKINKQLYELNEKLSTQLGNLNKQVSVLIHQQKLATHMETMHTRYSKEVPQEQFYTQDVVAAAHKENFAELSSILIEEAEQADT